MRHQHPAATCCRQIPNDSIRATLQKVNTASKRTLVCVVRPRSVQTLFFVTFLDGVAWSVCLSVCLFVTIVSPAKRLNRSRCRLGYGLEVGPIKPALYGNHIGETWRMILNCPCAAAMQASCQITSTTCFLSRSVRYRRSTLSIPVSFSAYAVHCCVGISARTYGYRTMPTTVGISRTWRPRCSRPWTHGWSSVPPDWINPGPTTVFVRKGRIAF